MPPRDTQMFLTHGFGQLGNWLEPCLELLSLASRGKPWLWGLCLWTLALCGTVGCPCENWPSNACKASHGLSS